MGRASNAELMPPDLLERFQELLRDPRIAQLDATQRINKLLAERGEALRMTKSSTNRYDIKMRKVGEKIRQSREMAEMWIAKAGAMPQGKVGQLINEMLRTVAFELTLKLQEGEITKEDMPAIIDMLKQLSLAVQRLENAATLNARREKEIRQQERETAAAIVQAEARAAGISDDTIEAIRAKLGIAA